MRRNQEGALTFRFALLLALLALSVRAADPPVIELFVGGGPSFTGPNFYVNVDKSGQLSLRRIGLPFLAPGRLSEQRTVVKLSEKELSRLVRLAEAAGSDFSSGCGNVADGNFAHLVLRTGTQTRTRDCRNASVWPVGSRSKAFIAAVNEKLPVALHVQ